MKKLIGFFLCVMLLPIQSAIAMEPDLLIRQTADQVLADIKINSAVYRENPEKLFALVDKVVLPHFDFDEMTNLALGRYQKKVTDEQKPKLVNEFRILLVRTYGKALLEYTDQKIDYLPMQGSIESGEVMVRTEIQQSGGFPIPLNYGLRKENEAWKVYDISVDGISLVTNYRSSFARQIKKSGIDGLIKTLKDRNEEL